MKGAYRKRLAELERSLENVEYFLSLVHLSDEEYFKRNWWPAGHKRPTETGLRNVEARLRSLIEYLGERIESGDDRTLAALENMRKIAIAGEQERFELFEPAIAGHKRSKESRQRGANAAKASLGARSTKRDDFIVNRYDELVANNYRSSIAVRIASELEQMRARGELRDSKGNQPGVSEGTVRRVIKTQRSKR